MSSSQSQMQEIGMENDMLDFPELPDSGRMCPTPSHYYGSMHSVASLESAPNHDSSLRHDSDGSLSEIDPTDDIEWYSNLACFDVSVADNSNMWNAMDDDAVELAEFAAVNLIEPTDYQEGAFWSENESECAEYPLDGRVAPEPDADHTMRMREITSAMDAVDLVLRLEGTDESADSIAPPTNAAATATMTTGTASATPAAVAVGNVQHGLDAGDDTPSADGQLDLRKPRRLLQIALGETQGKISSTPTSTNGLPEKENITPGMLVKLDSKATDMETRRILAFASPQVERGIKS
eukprot:m.1638600 g.1638600  ORF g.1638600 m.1638600 type:complete len:294 (+) comp29146_c0_seq1:176-1057(+)